MASDSARDSVRVAGWTLVSRTTGVVRVAVTGAVLGPTFFANIFQTTNLIPNITYNLVAGSLVATLLTPVLVGAIERDGVGKATRIARGYLGALLVGFVGAMALVLAAGPLLVRLMTMGIDQEDVASDARHHAWILLILVVPQILLYGLIAIGVAAQNARRRFALAAAAPCIENIGLVITLLVVGARYGTGIDTEDVSNGMLILLGTGATLSVLAHAAVQWLGAARSGITLWPSVNWHEREVRDALRRTVPSIGSGLVDAGWFFALLIGAGFVPGGVVAMQIGLNAYNLPIALGARSVGIATLPDLSRAAAARRWRDFRRAYDEGLGAVLFVALPSAVALALLSGSFARVLAFGELDTTQGIELLTAAIGTLGLAIVGASVYEFARQAAYGRLDAVSPLRAGITRFAVMAVGTGVVVSTIDGTAVVAALGAVAVVGELLAGSMIHRSVTRDLPDVGWRWESLRPEGVAVLAMAGVLVPIRLVGGSLGRAGDLIALSVGLVVASGAYLVVGSRLGSGQLGRFRGHVGGASA